MVPKGKGAKPIDEVLLLLAANVPIWREVAHAWDDLALHFGLVALVGLLQVAEDTDLLVG